MNRTQLRRAQITAVRRLRDPRYVQTQQVVYTGRTKAGVRMNVGNSMTIAAVWACVRYLSQSIAGFPWQVRKPIGPDGRSSEVWINHQVNYLVSTRASADWSSFQFRETMMHWALLRGNGYAEIERDVIGRPINLYPINPDRMEIYRNEETQELIYRVDGRIDLEPMDVFHVRAFGDGPVGLNFIAYAAESLGWAKAAQLFGASFFGNGATPAGIVTMKRPLSPDGLAELEERFDYRYGGPSNSNKTIFLDNEMAYQSISTEPEKGQFIETNQYLVEDIARWFGVPPHKIYQLLHATFSNIEHQSIEVVTDSLRPWAKRFEDEADYKLFGPQNRQGAFTRMDFTDMLRGDTKTRLEYYRGLREIGVLNTDEIREFEDLQPVGAAGGGNKRVMQSQYTTLEMIGEAPLVAGTPAEPAVEPDPEPDPDEIPDGQDIPPAPEPANLVRGLVALNRSKMLCPAN